MISFNYNYKTKQDIIFIKYKRYMGLV